jgi:hypothetical protein
VILLRVVLKRAALQGNVMCSEAKKTKAKAEIDREGKTHQGT